MEKQPDRFLPTDAKPSAGLNDPSNLVLAAAPNSIGKLKLREKRLVEAGAKASADTPANPLPAPPAADSPLAANPAETTQSVSVEELLGMPVSPSEPTAVDHGNMLIKPGVAYTTYRFKGHQDLESAPPPLPVDQPTAATTGDFDPQANPLAVNTSRLFFLIGNLLLAGAWLHFQLSWDATAWRSLGAVLAAQLLYMALGRAASHSASVLARTMVGAFTLFAALAAVGLLAVQLFASPFLLSPELLGDLPHPRPVAAAAFLFAASLTLAAHCATIHLTVVATCLVAAIAAATLPIGDLTAFSQTRNIISTPRPPAFSPPADWLPVKVATAARNSSQQTYRHRHAPLELTIARLADHRYDGSPAALEELADKLKYTLSRRPGTTASLVAKVNGKPHQRRIVTLTHELKTTVLVVGTDSDVLAFTVEAKHDIFDRHEDHVTSLFAAID